MDTLYPTLEAIHFQANHQLPVVISDAFAKTRSRGELRPRDIIESGLVSGIQKATGLGGMVLNVTGISDPTKAFEAYVIPPDLDRNNVLFNEARRRYMTGRDAERLLSRNEIIEGGVDLEKARVTGEFTKLPFVMCLGIGWFQRNSIMSPDEACSVVLHEIGHIFGLFEMLGRTVSTNYILENASKRLMGTQDRKRQYAIMEDIEHGGGIQISDREALLKQKTTLGITTVLLNDAVQTAKSELGYSPYDNAGFEKIADQFVTRMGYGKHYITGTDKAYRFTNPYMYHNNTSRLFINIARTLSYVTGIRLIMKPASFAKEMLAFMTINPYHGDYDQPKRRLEVVRDEMNRSLKEANLDRAEKQVILQDLELVNTTLSKMKENVWLYHWLWGTFFSPRAKRSQDIQRDLERLVNSNMNAALTRLELLGDLDDENA